MKKIYNGVASEYEMPISDYITNLQKKYEEADYDRHKLFEAKEKLQNDYQEAVDKITNLQEEIKRQSKAQVILDNQIAEMYDYKTRNEKAVEYMNDPDNFLCINVEEQGRVLMDEDSQNDLLNILQGKSDE